MESKFVDCSGLSCPEPVIKTRKALQETASSIVEVKVNSTVARDNVSRAAKSMGWEVKAEAAGEDFILTLTRGS